MVDWDNTKIMNEATEFAVENGYPVPVIVELSERMKRSWGRAYPAVGVIRLNKRFVEINDEDVVRALIRHEVVHLKHVDHGLGFRNDMRKHGGCSHIYEDGGMRIVVERYRYECVECGMEYKAATMLRGMYRCNGCDGWIEFRGVEKEELHRYNVPKSIQSPQLLLMNF